MAAHISPWRVFPVLSQQANHNSLTVAKITMMDRFSHLPIAPSLSWKTETRPHFGRDVICGTSGERTKAVRWFSFVSPRQNSLAYSTGHPTAMMQLGARQGRHSSSLPYWRSRSIVHHASPLSRSWFCVHPSFRSLWWRTQRQKSGCNGCTTINDFEFPVCTEDSGLFGQLDVWKWKVTEKKLWKMSLGSIRFINLDLVGFPPATNEVFLIIFFKLDVESFSSCKTLSTRIAPGMELLLFDVNLSEHNLSWRGHWGRLHGGLWHVIGNDNVTWQ